MKHNEVLTQQFSAASEHDLGGETLNEHVSRTVAVALAARGVAQKECCEALGIHRATMSNYVNGRLPWQSAPGGRLLDKIAAFTGLTVQDFLPPLTTDKSLRLVSRGES